MSFGTGIGVGYILGWAFEMALWKWLGGGIAMAALTFYYLWPVFYLLLCEHAFNWSEKLWSHVNVDGKSSYYSDNRPPAWFSQFLMLVGYAAIIVAAAGFGWHQMFVVHDSIANWGGIGSLLGLFASIIVGILFIALLVVIANLVSGWLVLISIIIGVVYCTGHWESVKAIAVSFSGYALGAVAGLIVAGISGGIAWAMLHWGRIPLLALLSGVVLTLLGAPHTAAMIGAINLGPVAAIAPALVDVIHLLPIARIVPALPWLAYGLELLVYIGFIFPISHIVITHTLKRLPDIFKLWESVYQEEVGGYREFAVQIFNISLVALVCIPIPCT